MSIYSNVKRIESLVPSSTKLIKKAIKQKKGRIINQDSIATLPEEVRTITAVKRNENAVISNTSKTGVIYENTQEGSSVSVYNKLTKILLSFTDGDSTHFVITKDNIKNQTQTGMLYNNPDYGDNNFHTTVISNSDTIVEIFPVYTYFIFRSIKNGIVNEYFSKDGIKWNPDFTEILSGYTPINNGRLCGLNDRCAYILSNDKIYEWDFVNRIVREDNEYNKVFHMEDANESMIFASTMNINFSISRKCIDKKWRIYYADTNNGFKYDSFTISNLYLNDNESITWVDAINTSRNTLMVMGYISTNDTNIEIITCEIIMKYDDSENLANKMIHYFKRTGISYNPIVDSIFCKPSLIEEHGLYFLSISNNIYFSEDGHMWTGIEDFMNHYSNIDCLVKLTSLDNDILVYWRANLKEKFIISDINLMTSRDVPENVDYINYFGKLRTGKASNNEFSMLSMGRIINNGITDHSAFNNLSLFDNSEYHMSQIIYRENWFFFFILDGNILKIYRSSDGSMWEDCTQIDMNGFRVFVSDNPFHARWSIKEINGLTYMIRPGILCDTAIRLHFNNGMVRAEASNTLFENGGVTWAKDVYGINNVRYICHSCIGVICAYIENNEIQKLILGTPHDFKIIAEDMTVGLNYMSYITNTRHDAILFDRNKYIYIDDGEVYISKDVLSNQDYLYTSKFIDFFRHDDYIIMVKDNLSNNDNFITIMKLDHFNNEINEVPNNQLREIFNKLRSMKYSPLATLHGNLLCIEDYQNISLSFSLDLDDDFNIAYVNDRSKPNLVKFIQYCNGITFRMNLTDKHTAITLSKLDNKANWIDSTYANGRYFTINDEDFNIYYSNDGVNWIRGVEYGDIQMSNIIATGDVILLYNKEALDSICCISYDNGNTWQYVDYVSNIQNVEVLDDQFVFFIGKERDGKKYNHIYITNNNYTELKFYSTDIIGSSVLKRDYRDITQNEDGVWVAITGDGIEVVSSNDGVKWKETRLPRNQSWTCVNYGNGYFVAFAKDSLYGAYSIDGQEWYDIVLPEKCTINACAFTSKYGSDENALENIFVVLASNQRVFYFGTDSTPTNPFYAGYTGVMDSSVNWSRVIYQDNKFVAISPNLKYIAYSLEPYSNWNIAELPYAANWRYFLYASGIFLLLNKEKTRACTSINGINWIDNPDYIIDGSGQSLRIVHYTEEYFTVFILGENQFESEDEIIEESVSIEDEWIDIAKNGFKTVLISKNGVIMEKDNDSEIWYGIHLNDQELQYESYPINNVRYRTFVNDTHFLFTNENMIYIYTDNNWKKCIIDSSLVNYSFNPSMVYFNNKYYALTTSMYYFWSNDGYTWFTESFTNSNEIGIHKLCVVNDKLIMVGKYLYEFNDTDKTLVELNIDDDVVFEDICYNGSVYIAVGNPVDSTSTSRYIAMSEDYTSWIVIDLTSTLNLEINEFENYFTSIKYQDNYWYILITGMNKLIYSNDNGINWQVLTLEDSTSLSTMNNDLVILGDDYSAILLKESNTILYGNGTSWSTLPLFDEWDNDINSLVYDGIKFIISYNDRYVYSYDMITWYRTYALSEVIYGNGMFVAFDTSNNIDTATNLFYSYDGLTWDKISYEFGDTVTDIEYGDGKFIAILDNEDTKYFSSSNITEWTAEFIYRLSHKSSISYGHNGFIITENDSEYILLIKNRLTTAISKLPKPTTYVDISYGNLTYAAIQAGNNTISLFDDNYNYRFDIVIPESEQSNLYDKIEFVCGRFYIYSNLLNSIYVLEANGIYSEYNIKKYQLHYDVKEVCTGINNLPTVLNTNGNIIDIIDVDNEEYIESALKATVKTIIGYNGVLYGIDDSHVYSFDEDGLILDVFETPYSDLENIITGNGLLIITRKMQYEYLVNIGNDITKWNHRNMINEMNITDISYTNGYFVAEIYADKEYLAFSKDCNDWFINDIDTEYNVNLSIGITNGTVWFLNGKDTIDILKLKDHVLLLTASGFVISDLDIKSPQKPTMAKGSFMYNTANIDQFIQLDFYPKKIFIRSRSYVQGTIYQTIISNTNDLYQNLNMDIENSQNTIELEFRSSYSSLNNKEDKSRITMNGFIANMPAEGIYDYYAIS